MKVFVYYNLHKKTWSIKALEGENKGKVIMYADSLVLVDVAPKVSEAGRQRVIKEQCKNVHAGLVGDLLFVDPIESYKRLGSAITYNPYFCEYFHWADTKKPYKASQYVYLSDKKAFAW